ncbi:MAG: hypothetical protein OEW09_11840 [Anaerolineae bacterium]|nr:hypothetical protein [Anaerolineae bacterium]
MKRLSIRNGSSILPSVPERFWVAAWTLGVVAIIGLGCSPFGPPAPAARTLLSVAPSPTPTFTPTAISSPTLELTPLLAVTPVTTPTAVSLAQAPPSPLIPAGGIVYAVTPNVNRVGWVRSGEDGNHFGDSYIHVGFLGGNVYHGAIQFDISFIPPGSSIHYAALELVGLSGETLGSGGAWDVRLLEEDIDADWPFHDYRTIHEASVAQTLSPTLGISDLAENELNVFVFNAGQRAVLESRLEGGLVAFRVDGPSSGADNLFTWDTGYGLGSLGKTPILRLAVTSPLPTPTSPAGTRIAARGPETPTPTFVIVTSTPTPETVFTAAAIAATAAYQATTVGTPTNTPSNWVTPIVVTDTPTPENEATATYMVAWLTAAAIATGTATPTPRHMWTATPTATPTDTPVYVPLEEITPTPTTPAPTSTPTAIPTVLIGKIAFLTDRDGDTAVYIMNPDGSGLARLTNRWAYDVANIQDTISPDGQNRVLVQDIQNVPQLIMQPLYDGYSWRITYSAFACYHPSWSPDGEYIAFVSQCGGHWEFADPNDEEIIGILRFMGDTINDDIYLKPIYGVGFQRLTDNPWEFDKHPSWSPDNRQIVFCSNRETGHSQIWMMNADGSDPRNLSNDPYNNWDPVWIKRPELLKALP